MYVTDNLITYITIYTYLNHTYPTRCQADVKQCSCASAILRFHICSSACCPQKLATLRSKSKGQRVEVNARLSTISYRIMSLTSKRATSTVFRTTGCDKLQLRQPIWQLYKWWWNIYERFEWCHPALVVSRFLPEQMGDNKSATYQITTGNSMTFCKWVGRFLMIRFLPWRQKIWRKSLNGSGHLFAERICLPYAGIALLGFHSPSLSRLG